MEIYTIGFTKKSASSFFDALKARGVQRLVDVRVNNTSQLAGFAKRNDLAYFLRRIIGADYVHSPLLAPTKELLKRYRAGEVTWDDYEVAFLDLMSRRRIETEIPSDLFSGRAALLCSEPTPDRCHRRLVVEYLDRHWGAVRAVHL